MFADWEALLIKVFQIKNVDLSTAKEHASVILNMLKKELALQQAFYALE